MVKNSISVTRDMRTDLNLQLRHEKAEHLRGGTRKIYHTGKKTKIKIQFWFKGQLKRWDKLTSIARFWSPENGFEGIFEKFVFVLEISAVKVEELCGTNSRFSSFSEKILSGDFCLWRHWWSLLSVWSWCSYRTKEFVSSEPGSQEVDFEDF